MLSHYANKITEEATQYMSGHSVFQIQTISISKERKSRASWVAVCGYPPLDYLFIYLFKFA